MTGDTPKIAKIWLPALLWFALVCVFLPWLPTTVQYGDSGELVANAFALRVSHPPGFPLYHWLLHLFLRLPLGLTPYGQAALFSAFCMAGAITLLVRRLDWRQGVPLAALLAFNPVVLRQALLPDVFALHALLCVMVMVIALGGERGRGHWIAFCLALALAGANHPSAIFLLPLVFSFRRVPASTLASGFLSSLVVFLLFYASLLLFDRGGALAWPIREGWTGVLRHALRFDYGSFRLSSTGPGANWLDHIRHFLGATYTLWIALLVATALWWRQKPRIAITRAELCLLACLLLYLGLFYALANLAAVGFGAFVMERFHLLPALLVGALLRQLLGRLGYQLPLAILLLALAATSVWSSLPQNQWQRDKVLEDLARNFRAQGTLSRKDCVVFLTNNDSIWGALTYLETISPSSRKILPLVSTLFANEGYQEKVAGLGLMVTRKKSQSLEAFDLDADFVEPNLPRCDFFTLESARGTTGRRVTFLPLGRMVSAGAGEAFSFGGLDSLEWSAPPLKPPGYSLPKAFHAYYAHLPLYLGLAASRKGDWAEARRWFERAHAIAPYLIPPKRNLCATAKQLGRDDTECLRELEVLEREEFPYL